MNNIEKRFKGVENSKTFKNILDILDLKSKTVLDIGCSYGEFLCHFGNNSVGLTVSHKEVEYGKLKGLNIKRANIEDDRIVLDQQFDVVFANNIIEHLHSPHRFLVETKKFLKSDGILVLGVPCFPKVVSLLKLRKFRGCLASNHINFFTRDTLKETVLRAGWNISEVRSFHIKNKILDHTLSIITPHFYVVATPIKNFEYNEKRRKELEGY